MRGSSHELMIGGLKEAAGYLWSEKFFDLDERGRATSLYDPM
jgi:hypothetical protein